MSIHQRDQTNTSITRLIPGVVWAVGVAKSLTGDQPDEFYPSDTIDLNAIERYDLFYVYLQLEYINNSGSELTDAQITVQLPIQGEPNYYEPYAPSAPPAGWVTYPNDPTSEGNTDFPPNTFSFDPLSRVITWNASKPLNNGSSGIVFIKIPMRDPYTDFGTFEYAASFHTAQGDDSESASFTIDGLQDELPYEITRQTNLGFTPEAPDADQYYYHRYFYTTSYNPNYMMPPPEHEHDQSFINAPAIRVTLPPGAEVLATGNATTVTPGYINLSSYQSRNTYFVIRYPKSLYPDPNMIISLDAIAVGRYVGELPVDVPIPSTQQIFSHAVGDPTVIPAPALGQIRLASQPSIQYSNEGFLLGSQPISRGAYTFRRNLDTIIADEVLISFQNVDYVQDGVETESNYGYNMIYLEQLYWSGASDPLKPVYLTITAVFDDSSTEVLSSMTQEEILATGGYALYGGNVPGKRMAYDPPAGKVLKKIIFSVRNAPAGLYCRFYLNGFITDYPPGGAEFIRQHYTKIVYGYDTGSGRPEGGLSGDFYIERPILRDTVLQPSFTVSRITGSAVNPGGLDTIRLNSFFTDSRFDTYLNPAFGLLLAPGYSYEGFVNSTTEFTNTAVYNVYNLPDGKLLDTPPTVTATLNYNGSGRTLVRVQYYGLLQPCEILGADITVRAAASIEIGNHEMSGYFWSQNPDFQNILNGALTPIVLNTYDIMDTGNPEDLLFGRDLIVSVSRGVGTLLYTTMKGSFDPELTDTASTKQGTIIDGNITMDYNGITPMEGIQLTTILPYEGDPNGSMWGPPVSDQRMTLAAPVDMSGYPGAVVYYNLSRTDNPLAPGWTTVYSAQAASVRIDMAPDFILISGGRERIDIPLRLQMPGTAMIGDLPSVLGVGVLPAKAYDATVILPETGLDGDTSSIRSIALSIDVFVFHDVDGSGTYDPGDSPYAGVLVQVFHGDDDPDTAPPLYSGFTDSEGLISFVDGFGATLDFDGYKVRVVKPAGDAVFTQGPDVTVDEEGQEIVMLTANNPNASIVAGIQNSIFDLNGRYWINLHKPANGLFNPGDLPYQGAEIRLFNVTINEYEPFAAETDADGYYQFPPLPKGPVYRVEFPLNSAQMVSPVAPGGNMITELEPGIGSYTFDSSTIVGNSYTVNGAVYENGNIQVLFMEGTTIISESEILVRQLETTYTAYIGTVEDTTPEDYGTFVVPAGYRLVAGEPTSKTATIDYNNRTAEIIFFVERITALTRVLKVDSITDEPLSGAVFTGEGGIDYVTDADGYAVFGPLALGTFPFLETQPPAGYNPNPTAYEVLITENPDSSVNVYLILDGGPPIQLLVDTDGFYTIGIPNTQTIVNEASLRIYKYDESDPDLGIGGATFLDIDSQQLFTTNLSGYALLGQYQSVQMQLQETVTPPGYLPNPNLYGIEVITNPDQSITVLTWVNASEPTELPIDSDGYYTLAIPNEANIPPPERADITLHKVDRCDQSIALAGAQFQDQYGNIYTTDDNGNVSLGSILLGDTLILREITPPPGYEPNLTEYSLTVISNGDTLAVQVYQNGVLVKILEPTGDDEFIFVVTNQRINPPCPPVLPRCVSFCCYRCR